jgi:hypothetical protein
MTAAALVADARFVIALARAGFAFFEGFWPLTFLFAGSFFTTAADLPRLRDADSGRRLCGVDLGIYQQCRRMQARSY